MMTLFHLQIIAQNQLAAVERILRTIRHRGGQIETMTLKTDEQHIYLDVALKMERTVSTMIAQLDKLIDIEHIRLID